MAVLIAANKPHFCRALSELFQEAGCRILGAGNTKSVLHEVSLAAADLIVIGVSAGEHSEELSSGLPFRQSLDKVPVFLITDQSSEELAIQAYGQ